MKLSVIIPASNEVGSIAETVEYTAGELDRAEVEHEILVIDDASSDGTAVFFLSPGATNNDLLSVQIGGTGAATALAHDVGSGSVAHRPLITNAGNRVSKLVASDASLGIKANPSPTSAPRSTTYTIPSAIPRLLGRKRSISATIGDKTYAKRTAPANTSSVSRIE